MTEILLEIVSGFGDSHFFFFILPTSRFSIVRLSFTPISHHIYKVHTHRPFLSLTYNRSKKKKKKVPITHINIKERSKYTRVTVMKFKGCFTLSTTYTVTKVLWPYYQFRSERQGNRQ